MLTQQLYVRRENRRRIADPQSAGLDSSLRLLRSWLRSARFGSGRLWIDGRMSGRKISLCGRASRIQNVAEIRQAARVNSRIVVWILSRIGMLDHSASSLRFQNQPSAIALLQVVRDLHSCSRWSAGFRAEFHFGVRQTPINRNAS